MKQWFWLILFLPLPTLAQGGGQAADPNAVDLADPKYMLLEIQGESQEGLGIAVIAVGDLNQDGLCDFTIASRRNMTRVFLGHTSTRPTELQAISGKMLPRAVADLTGDSIPDLICEVRRDSCPWLVCSGVRVFKGSKNGFDTLPLSEVYSPTGNDFFGDHCRVADFDGDGKQELMVFAPQGSPPTIYIYKFQDSVLLQQPWFVWQVPAYSGIQVADVDNDGKADILAWGWESDNFNNQLYVAYGRNGDVPDTGSPVHLQTSDGYHITAYNVAPLVSDSINDIIVSVSNRDKKPFPISRAYVFQGLHRKLTASDLEPSAASATVHDPIEFDTVNTNYSAVSTSLLGNVNGSGEPSMVRVGYASGVPVGGYEAFLYSGGKALDTRYDGTLELNSDAVVVDLGDVDGDSIHDFAVGDQGYNSGAGRVLIIKGSRDYPHTPIDGVNETSTPNDLSLSCYPNPVSNRATISMHVPRGHAGASLVITDALGRVVEQRARFSSGDNGYYTMNLNTSRWPAGMYMMRLGGAMDLRSAIIHIVR